jgi:hypothetical protein
MWGYQDFSFRKKHVLYIDMQSKADVVPPSLSAHESLWKEIPSYTVFWLTATLDMPPQIAVKKQWCCGQMWQYVYSVQFKGELLDCNTT